MHTDDFGGFSTKACTIDLRFHSREEIDHFIALWTRRGRPDIDHVPEGNRFRLISVGTTLEHELRHYHDFLLGYTSIHNLWLRTTAMANSISLIKGVLENPDIDCIVFPLVKWAALSEAERAIYLVDARGSFGTMSRTWQPPVIRGPRPIFDTEVNASFDEPDTVRNQLYLLRDQMGAIEGVRSGVNSPTFPFPLTPRLASELSAFVVQCASVLRTYGVTEFDRFLNRIASDGSVYTQFFRGVIRVFSRRMLVIDEAQTAVIDGNDVDWRALSVAATWCFCGSPREPQMLLPAVRLSRLLDSALFDFDETFPPRMNGRELLTHLDSRFGVEPSADAAKRSQAQLWGYAERTYEKMEAAGLGGSPEAVGVGLFKGLLRERDRLITKLFDDPDGYLDLASYVDALPFWPQCPVLLDFRPAGIVLPTKTLATLGKHPRLLSPDEVDGASNDELAAGALYQSFLPGGSELSLDAVELVSEMRAFFDFFFDPHQTTETDERIIRLFVKTQFEKDCIRLI